ncbi:class I adenylate-forming enzyme family protein [Salinibacterium sp. ZJ450]|uniref:class I adenylate-forming enzyme family protein n=1 Tax=Salinibacterium sp. ZJ450 TaxID=2708338 RepID=UPI0014249119|nr:class I adenylate-forming enzyme family protein [Salinibacterium sp. ZJ450]
MQDPTDETFHELWSGAVHSHRNRTFLIFSEPAEGAAEWTYGEFDRLVSQTARRLADLGVLRGDSVHVALKNSPAFVLLWLAAAKLGAWIVPVDPASTSRDIASQIRRTQPKVGFYAASRRDAYLTGSADQLTLTIELTEAAADALPGSPLLALNDARDVSLEWAAVSPTDRLAVMFTSGTTSEPKGVMLTQRNYVRLAHSMANLVNLQPQHRWLVTLPMFHANGQFYCFSPAIATGASVALVSAFSASGWFQQAADLGVTHASLFAAPIRMILARRPDDAPHLQLEHLWYAQSLGEEHYREFAERVGCQPRQLYGMTETCAIVTADLGTAPRPDVIGSPIPGRTIELLDPVTEELVPQGEPGMMTVRGSAGDDVFAGYLDDPATTARSFSTRNGEQWFRTGDLARADADGTLRFVGRVDDVIKVSGENVSLTEVESVVAQAPGVLEAAVLAKSDPIRDQVPVAFVVARDPEEPPVPAELMAWAELNLPPQSRPREWTVIDELPRTSVGKIRRFQLQAAVQASEKASA